MELRLQLSMQKEWKASFRGRDLSFQNSSSHGFAAESTPQTLCFLPRYHSDEDMMLQPDNTLRIHQTSGSHSGKYVCTASNSAGEAEIAAGVIVLSPPVIAPGQISYNLIQGNPVTLPCEVQGEPMPKITWFVTFCKLIADFFLSRINACLCVEVIILKEIGEMRHIGRYLNGEEFTGGYVDEDGSLTIENAGELHRGQFKCVASNDVGKDEKVVTLTVHTAPTIEGSGQVGF